MLRRKLRKQYFFIGFNFLYLVSRCGICVGGNTKRTTNFGINACNMCASTDPLCIPGCNGDPSLSRDNCGRCLARNDVTRDSK